MRDYGCRGFWLYTSCTSSPCCLYRTRLFQDNFFRFMDLLSMIEAGGKMKIEVSSDDLVLFADRLIEKAMEAKALMMEQTPEDETWLSTDEVAKMCGVCETTLWSWEKKGYLVPSRMGRKKRYALSAIQKLLSSHTDASAADR